MKRIFGAFLLVTLSIASVAQYDPEALKVLDAMSDKYKKVEVFSADFEQQLTNKSAGLKESISGSITVKGNRYKLRIADQEVFHDGVDIYTYSKEINEITIAPYEEEDELSLSNVYDIYKEGFKYGVQSIDAKGTTFIDLEPEERGKSYFKIRMEIDNNYSLNSFSVFEPSGNVYVYSIQNFEEKEGITDAFFAFRESDFPDVEVVDFR